MIAILKEELVAALRDFAGNMVLVTALLCTGLEWLLLQVCLLVLSVAKNIHTCFSDAAEFLLNLTDKIKGRK
jgi:hypothetical protein